MSEVKDAQQEPKAESNDSSVGQDDLVLGDKAKAAKDVASIDDLKAAYQNLKTGKVSDKSEEPIPDEKTDVSPDEDNLDSLLEEVVKEKEVELAKKRESLADKTDRPDINKIKELERKIDELRQAKEPPPVQPLSDKWFLDKSESLGMDVDDFKKIVKVLDLGFNDNVKPFVDGLYEKINALENKLTNKDITETISKDKLYKLVKPDYDDILENDETVRSLPPSQRNKVALALAKERNMEKVLDIVRRAKNTSPKKLVVNDGGSVSAPPPAKKSGVQLTRDDIVMAERLGYTRKDLENLGKVQRTFIEE